jgi:hypothetical protein
MTILVDKFPFRTGTKRHRDFKRYRNGMTRQQAIKAGADPYRLWRAERDKLIRFK